MGASHVFSSITSRTASRLKSTPNGLDFLATAVLEVESGIFNPFIYVSLQ
jgi:hypothetical protein